MTAPLFQKVLVANRGEIACRVVRTLDAMGIGSAAIYHRVDTRAKHCKVAGEAVEIFGDTPVSAYLDIDQIIAAARSAGADAIHPGYGFLSENPRFAAAVAAAGMTFIGPDAATIDLMGDKISARNFAAEHGVAVAPSVMPTSDLNEFARRAEKIGFPLLIKAVAGGGGKGMSIVRNAADIREAVRVASSEAQRYFGDGRIYAETYVDHPRHIEVQVLGDGAGNAIHLFERECSVQRRFQKIIEEAPAASLDKSVREAICASAAKLAAAAKYKNAGTIEYILGADGRFFFLEMNTRLQVEHPVTEMITGLDLVRAQIEIAAGKGLPVAQSQVTCQGHAIECRICAENTDRDFMPETGVVEYLSVPEETWIRFESALEKGQKVTADFNSMLAKLVVHGAGRQQAIDQAIKALDALAILGVTANVDYLARVLDHQSFRDGDLHTGFIAQHRDTLTPAPLAALEKARVLAAAALGFRDFHALALETPEPYATIGGWRN